MKQREMQECGIDIINLVINKYHLTYQEAFFMLAAITESLAETMITLKKEETPNVKQTNVR